MSSKTRASASASASASLKNTNVDTAISTILNTHRAQLKATINMHITNRDINKIDDYYSIGKPIHRSNPITIKLKTILDETNNDILYVDNTVITKIINVLGFSKPTIINHVAKSFSSKSSNRIVAQSITRKSQQILSASRSSFEIPDHIRFLQNKQLSKLQKLIYFKDKKFEYLTSDMIDNIIITELAEYKIFTEVATEVNKENKVKARNANNMRAMQSRLDNLLSRSTTKSTFT